jgi:hypothetical protein
VSETLDFLRLVLPRQGFYCAVTIINNQWRHRFFTKIEDMTEHIRREDEKGYEVYHACATFKTSRMDSKDVKRLNRKLGRTHHNIQYLKSFWLDIDCGEGKPYATQLEGYNRLTEFCRACSLPSPVCVNSGYGLHVYWPLAEELGIQAWKGYAETIAYLCKDHGLFVDRPRSCDPSSVLRPVGSHNRKKGEIKEVTWSGLIEPYEIGEFDGLRGSESLSKRQHNEKMYDLGNASSDRNDSLFSAALNLYGPSPTGGEVAEQCAQLAAMRDRGGAIPEPGWYACLGVLAHCSDGERLAHEWSASDERYNYEDTEAKLERAREFGPTLCERFIRLNSLCEGCELRGNIVSPLHIRSRPLFSYENTDRGSEDHNGIANGRDIERESPLDPLASIRSEFPRTDKGLYFLQGGKTENSVPVLISRYDIRLKSINVSESYGAQHSLTFEHETPNEGVSEFTIDKKVFFGTGGMAELAGKGPTIHDTELFKRYVRKSIDLWHETNKVTVSYNQLGWKDNFKAFLLGDILYKENSTERVQPSPDVAYKAKDLGPKKGGSLVEWSRAANELYTKGLEPHAFAVLASFAAPLMRCHVDSEGGAVVAMVTNKSGTGKSTALDAVSSVWGARSALEMTNRDTEISRAISLGVLGNLPVVLDELRFRDQETTRDFITMFTVGKDKTRATREGTLQQNNYRWQTILVGGSNYSLVDMLATDASNALALRVLEFSADMPFDQRRGDQLRRQLVANWGFAGDAFLKTVLQPGNLDFIRQALPKWTTELYDACKLTREHRFWVRTAVAVLCAATIVRQAGILEFSVKGLKDWILETLVSKARMEKGVVDATPSSILGSFLSEHVLDTMTVSGPSGKGTATDVQIISEPRRNLFIRFEQQGRLMYIDKMVFNKWCYKYGFQKEEIVKELYRIKVFVNINANKVLTSGTGRAGASRPVYVVDGMHQDVLGYVMSDQQVLNKIVPIRR